jgi:hypothetical protein
MVNLLVIGGLLLVFACVTGTVTTTAISSVVTLCFALTLLAGVIHFFTGPPKGPL